MSLTFSITNYPTGISPSSVAIGDLNGDGRLDLVTANIGGDPLGTPTPAGTVSVLLGNGGGTFSAATPYPTGSVIPSSVAIGDLNGDGRLDLAVTNYGSPSSLVPAGTVSVFLGAGGGTLAAATQYPTGTGLPGAQSVAIGDLNGDGRLDLAVANSSSSISVLLGQAGGGFLTLSPRALSPVNNFSSVALADLNGTPNWISPSPIMVLPPTTPERFWFCWAMATVHSDRQLCTRPGPTLVQSPSAT